MLRTALRTSYRLRHLPQHARRSFVSSVLLSKTYEDKTVAELRSELRARGLSASGAKATLITRIQQADARSASETMLASSSNTPGPSSPAPSHHQSQARSVSSSSSSHAEVASSIDATTRFAPITFDVKLPDLSQPPPQRAVQVPFVPDFWDSSAKKREGNAGTGAASLDSSTPKIILMAGAETHIAGGPTFAMSPASNTFLPSSEAPSSSPSSSSVAQRKYDGLLGDVLDDLGVPHNVLGVSPNQESFAVKRTTVSRPLDEEERRGAITLLGLIFGAWVVAGLAAPSKSKSGKKGVEKAH
ncbi:uncharacterized protein FOMMEDRAFT_141404 [Fomitiporia mediterranea MF3/22]|uniref:uncharacterized protein n=1 Tax=Fomitiporia mediterranea (strain MF3/22) TaxID=694068 RepID=UPI00044092DF|nr:uncharacterized protein FOMMEDRAFT_141404 [Fomitiporia mediterranea MF3/22]EJD02320.1 hypothetical protein FOMMEDRAFT_141404 [Fomitiporia mediterranea MF3/22]